MSEEHNQELLQNSVEVVIESLNDRGCQSILARARPRNSPSGAKGGGGVEVWGCLLKMKRELMQELDEIIRSQRLIE